MKKAARTFPKVAAAVIAVALLAALWPLLKPGFFVTDDGEWMVIRLSAFYQSLAQGQFPVRFLGRLNNSYGYPVANFLYPGFLYIGSLFRIAGLPFVAATKAVLGLSVIGTAVALYAGLRHRFTMKASIMGVLSFVFAPYLLYDLYTRGSVGEILALFSGAVAVVSLVRRLPWLLAPSVALLILSHNTLGLIVGLCIAVMVLLSPDRMRMAVAILLGVLTAAFFWLPALVERQFVRFDATVISDPSRYFISPETAMLLGFPTVISLILYFGMRHKYRRDEAASAAFAVAGLLLSLPLTAALWHNPTLAKLVQFPYRFLSLTVLFGPFVVAAIFDRLKGWRGISLGVLFCLLWAISLTQQQTSIRFVNRPAGYYETNEATTNVADEYMPKWVSDIPKSRPAATLEIIDGDATLSRQVFAGENIRADITAKEASILRINKVYYPGWGVTLNNRLVPVDYRNPTGVMLVGVPSGTHTIAASFRETPFRFIADMVSLASIIVYAVLMRRFLTLT